LGEVNLVLSASRKCLQS